MLLRRRPAPAMYVQNSSGLTPLEVLEETAKPDYQSPGPSIFVRYDFGTWTKEGEDRIRELLLTAACSLVVEGGGIWIAEEDGDRPRDFPEEGVEKSEGPFHRDDGKDGTAEMVTTVQELFWALRAGDVARVRMALEVHSEVVQPVRADNNILAVAGSRSEDSAEMNRIHVNARCVPADFPSNLDGEREWPYRVFDGEYEDTLLHLAVRYRHAAMVQLLLEHGADESLRNEAAKSVLDVARDPTEILCGPDQYVQCGNGRGTRVGQMGVWV